MIKKIDHIGIAVKNLENTLDIYKKLYGLNAIKIEAHEDIKVRIAFVPLGEVLIRGVLNEREKGLPVLWSQNLPAPFHG